MFEELEIFRESVFYTDKAQEFYASAFNYLPEVESISQKAHEDCDKPGKSTLQAVDYVATSVVRLDSLIPSPSNIYSHMYFRCVYSRRIPASNARIPSGVFSTSAA